MKIFSIILFSFLFMGKTIFAQDVHLSQFYTAQLNLNPALAGYYEGSYRIAGNYRNQWRQINKPVTTAMIAYDKKFPFFSDEIDAGILVLNDRFSGFNQNVNKILLAVSYKKTINYHELRAGIQAGAVFKSTDLSSQTFPNQWVYDQGEFDVAVNNLENTLSQSQNYADINVGVSWSKTFNKIKPTAGISLFHLNRPKDTYFASLTERLRTTKVFHGEANIELNHSLSVEPKILFMTTTKAQNLLVGTNIKYYFQNSKIKNIYGGVLYRDGFKRNNDAIIPVIGLAYKQFDIGFSYDVNISNLSDYSARKSTLEFSLIYTAPLFSPGNLTIPCDRY